MLIDREEFNKSEFGQRIAESVRALDLLKNNSAEAARTNGTEKIAADIRVLTAEIKAYMFSIETFYGEKYEFEREANSYGLLNSATNEWLLKYDRKTGARLW